MFLIIHIDLKCASQGQAQLLIMQDGRVELTISARSKNRVHWSSFLSTPCGRSLLFCSCNSSDSAHKNLAGFSFFLDSKETCTYKTRIKKRAFGRPTRSKHKPITLFLFLLGYLCCQTQSFFFTCYLKIHQHWSWKKNSPWKKNRSNLISTVSVLKKEK